MLAGDPVRGSPKAHPQQEELVLTEGEASPGLGDFGLYGQWPTPSFGPLEFGFTTAGGPHNSPRLPMEAA